jgi:hypothetical protein
MTHEQDHETSDVLATAHGRRVGLGREVWDFVRHNKKWWLLPILAVILLVGLLVILGSTGAAPFIYALF